MIEIHILCGVFLSVHVNNKILTLFIKIVLLVLNYNVKKGGLMSGICFSGEEVKLFVLSLVFTFLFPRIITHPWLVESWGLWIIKDGEVKVKKYRTFLRGFSLTVLCYKAYFAVIFWGIYPSKLAEAFNTIPLTIMIGQVILTLGWSGRLILSYVPNSPVDHLHHLLVYCSIDGILPKTLRNHLFGPIIGPLPSTKKGT